MNSLAPIVLFAFNRLDVLKNTISSLLNNREAKDSTIYIYVDGARANKVGEQAKVDEVQKFVRSIVGFKEVNYLFSEKNKGLASSVIDGVTNVINRYGKAIVLEDDLVFSSNFLAFMNAGLNCYESEERVFSICGYTNEVKVPPNYHYDAYFCTRSSSWGWATWADRWNSVDWELNDWDQYSARGREFNRWGGSDCFQMLKSVKFGNGNSWAIRFGFAQFLQDKLSLFPIVSKVKNDGFDGDGTNCKKWSRFKYKFDEVGRDGFRLPETVILNRQLYRSAMSYHTIMIRLWSRLMYILHP
ncbi:MAG: glycosyltransferase [Rikenellaceae bacterium]